MESQLCLFVFLVEEGESKIHVLFCCCGAVIFVRVFFFFFVLYFYPCFDTSYLKANSVSMEDSPHWRNQRELDYVSFLVAMEVHPDNRR